MLLWFLSGTLFNTMETMIIMIMGQMKYWNERNQTKNHEKHVINNPKHETQNAKIENYYRLTIDIETHCSWKKQTFDIPNDEIDFRITNNINFIDNDAPIIDVRSVVLNEMVVIIFNISQWNMLMIISHSFLNDFFMFSCYDLF